MPWLGLLPHPPQILQTAVYTFDWRVGITFLLHDVPLGASDAFTNGKDLIPVNIALADERLVVRFGILFEVHRSGSTRIALEEWHGVGTAVKGVARV